MWREGKPTTGLARLSTCLGLALLAVVICHHTMIFSGFSSIQGELRDTRFVHYTLEYNYQAVTEDSLDVWHPPFFHPERNVAAHSDLMLTMTPFYGIWWVLGVDPSTSFQIWMIVISLLNFFAFYFLLGRALRLSHLSSCVGALLFSVNSTRLAQMIHPQMVSHVYILISLIALVYLLRSRHGAADEGQGRRLLGLPAPKLRSVLLSLVFVFGIVAQLYSGVYNGYFFILALVFAFLFSMAVKSLRGPLLRNLKEGWCSYVIAMALGTFAMIPWLQHYLGAMGDIGPRPWEEVAPLLPQWRSWIHTGPGNYAYGKIATWSLFAEIPRADEHRIGFGLLTSVVFVVGYVRSWDKSSWVLLATAVGLVLITFDFFGVFSVWKLLYLYLPGANAIRIVTRVSLILLIPVAVGFALFVDSGLKSKARYLLVNTMIIAVFCVLEQVSHSNDFDKAGNRQIVDKVAAGVKPECKAFIYIPMGIPDDYSEHDPYFNTRYHLDAMWASLKVNTPTVNGYSGKNPIPWGLTRIVARNEEELRRIRRNLDIWLGHHKMRAADICIMNKTIDGRGAPVPGA